MSLFQLQVVAVLGLLGAHPGQQGSHCFPEGEAAVRTHAQQSLEVRLLFVVQRQAYLPLWVWESDSAGDKVICQDVGTTNQQNLGINANTTAFGPVDWQGLGEFKIYVIKKTREP